MRDPGERLERGHAEDLLEIGVDHATLGVLERQYQAEVVQAHGPDDALDLLRQGKFDLVLVNRKLDALTQREAAGLLKELSNLKRRVA